MKAVMVMFDSLNRHMLPPYGCDWVHAPNFKRLAERTVVFDSAYVGSMPCMPARREIHTGRYNFLHRSWGPLEPFDDSMPEILKKAGVYTHLSTDHYHYWEDGGATYHSRYSSFELSRGQEGDQWVGEVAEPEIPECVSADARAKSDHWRQDWINRKHMAREELQPQAKTFADGLQFIRRNAGQDNWFLHIETFDPHEPFFTQAKYKALYPHDYEGAHFDWPPYREVSETREQVEHCRYEYAALVSMCDEHLGKVLDLMDELDLWNDTMLIVNTDHGFLLAEHDCWAKCWMPFWEEVSHTPLFIWDPRAGARGQRRGSLVQTIDLAPTILEYFGVERPADMQGASLRRTVADDAPVREGGLFGIFGGHVNVTDGRYVYMRSCARDDNRPLYNYTHMPTHMRGFFSVAEMQTAQMARPFTFTKGCPVMKIDASGGSGMNQARRFGTALYDLKTDPRQLNPIRDAVVERRMIEMLVALMKAGDAPPEQFERLGLPQPAAVPAE
ncbi:MAG TPA: sulfatase [Phycisphaerae bacterium]|nr:sulfatase [Phycisphaerae bacterium]